MSSANNLNLGPGLHYGIPAEAYHADPVVTPSLSSGLARVILESSVAHAHHQHPRLGGAKQGGETPAMDRGSLIHALLAGEENDTIEVGLYDDFKSKAAREWRDSVRAQGKTPVLEKLLDAVQPVVKAIREKAPRGLSVDPFVAGKPEVTAVWNEAPKGPVPVMCRARYDRLVITDAQAYADIWDWKTCESASEDRVLRTIINEGYHIQAAFYKRGLAALRPDYQGRISFVFAFAEVDPPYAVRRVVLSEGFLSIGDAMVSRALRRWSHAIQTNEWPDGSGETSTLQPPDWMLRKLEEGNL